MFSVWDGICKGLLKQQALSTPQSPSFEIQFVKTDPEHSCLNYLIFLLYCPTFLDRREVCIAEQATTQPAITSLQIKKKVFLES